MERVVALCKGYLVRRRYDKESVLRRKYIIDEIFTTELSFVKHLNNIISLFKQPLEDSDGKVLPKLLVKTLFNNLSEILTSACINVNAFQIASIEWKYDSLFGNRILSTLKNMLPLAEYTLRWDYQTKALESAYKNKTFKGFVKLVCSKNEEMKEMSLEDLLIMFVVIHKLKIQSGLN